MAGKHLPELCERLGAVEPALRRSSLAMERSPCCSTIACIQPRSSCDGEEGGRRAAEEEEEEKEEEEKEEGGEAS
eukprot:SAG11_NODE_1212_length_5506_cov_3.818384_5_plen_75_part_00